MCNFNKEMVLCMYNVPLPFLLPTGSGLSVYPPQGMWVSAYSSFSLRSVTWSSVSPCMLGGKSIPWDDKSSIST